MVLSKIKDPKVVEIIEKYGLGFDVYYLGGKQDGYKEGYEDGYEEARFEIAKNLLKEGFSEEFVSDCTELPLSKIKEIKCEF